MAGENLSKENNPLFTLDQVGYLVEDIKKTANQLEDLLGIGPFEIHDWPPEDSRAQSFVDGQPADWRMTIGFAQAGSVHLELIQPAPGNPHLDAFLAQMGSGLHHLRFTVDDLDQAAAIFQQKGYRMLSCGQGAHKGSRWAYFDTREVLNGLIIELRSIQAVQESDSLPWLPACFSPDP
jgi:methylmalonyl-CoA/ethylmalonyl-CoA epimerase